MLFVTYLLRCRDGSYYCGYTKDLKARIVAHNKGTASKYTKPRRPVRIAYTEEFNSQREAMQREIEIKNLTRNEKNQLVEGYLKCKNPYRNTAKQMQQISGKNSKGNTCTKTQVI